MGDDSIRDRIAELEAERQKLVALRAEIAGQIKDLEHRAALALARIHGINAAIEELSRLVDDRPQAQPVRSIVGGEG